MDFLLDFLMEFEDIDMGLLFIIESMLDANYCITLNKNGVFCKNKELYWDEEFIDLDQIQDFLENKNKKTCKQNEDLDHINELDEIRYFPCFKLNSNFSERVEKCRITMSTARELFNSYLSWKIGGPV